MMPFRSWRFRGVGVCVAWLLLIVIRSGHSSLRAEDVEPSAAPTSAPADNEASDQPATSDPAPPGEEQPRDQPPADPPAKESADENSGLGGLPPNVEDLLPDNSVAPEQLLAEALQSMDRAAADLESVEKTADAVDEQQLVVDRLKQLLSNSNRSKSKPSPQNRHQNQNQRPKPSSEQNPTENPEDGTGASDPGDNSQRRADDENSSESSEQVDGPVTEGEADALTGAKANSFWGHLPPRQREALFRSLSDQYLPEYEARIRRYYEALAEKK